MPPLRELKNVNWKETAKLNILRYSIGVVIFMLLNYIFSPMPTNALISVAITAPILGLTIWGFQLLLHYVLFAIPFTGILGFAFLLIGSIGDPFIYLITKYYPNLIKVADYRIFNWSHTILVNDPPEGAIAGSLE